MSLDAVSDQKEAGVFDRTHELVRKYLCQDNVAKKIVRKLIPDIRGVFSVTTSNEMHLESGETGSCKVGACHYVVQIQDEECIIEIPINIIGPFPGRADDVIRKLSASISGAKKLKSGYYPNYPVVCKWTGFDQRDITLAKSLHVSLIVLNSYDFNEFIRVEEGRQYAMEGPDAKMFDL